MWRGRPRPRKVGSKKRPARVGLFLLGCHPERGSAVRRRFLYFQLHQLRSHFSCFDRQPPHAYRQVETAWPGAAWIKIEDAIFLFDLRLMAVAVYHHAESGGSQLQVELAEIVHDIDGHAAGCDDVGLRQSARPDVGVDVTADRGYGRDLRKRFEDFGSANVACVEDAFGSAQSLDRLGPQQAVGVGDNAEDHWSLNHLSQSPLLKHLSQSSLLNHRILDDKFLARSPSQAAEKL